MTIEELMAGSDLPAAPHRAVEALLKEKRTMPELGARSPIAEIDAWAVAELQRLEPSRLTWSDAPAGGMRAEADRLYRRIVGVGT